MVSSPFKKNQRTCLLSYVPKVYKLEIAKEKKIAPGDYYLKYFSVKSPSAYNPSIYYLYKNVCIIEDHP